MKALHELMVRLLAEQAEQFTGEARAQFDSLREQEWTIAAADLIFAAMADHTLTRADADVATEAARANLFGTRTSRHMLEAVARYLEAATVGR